jgi:hypothetical protein
MPGDPAGSRGGPTPPRRPSANPGGPTDERATWTAFAFGPHGPARRTSAIRGAIAAIVVLVIGLPLAIALPGGGSPSAASSPTEKPSHKATSHCARTTVAGGEKPPAVQPGAAAVDDTVFVFGPTPRAHGNRSVASSHIEVWLNTDEPDRGGTPLGAGPVKQLAGAKVGHDCRFALSFSVPRLRGGHYEIRAFAFTKTANHGWEDLGGRTLTVERHHPPAATRADASTFAADFLLARLIRAGGAAKAMLSDSAHFPATGDTGALFSPSYRSGRVRSVRAVSKDTFKVGVTIAIADGPALGETLKVGEGTNSRGDDLSLVVLGVKTADQSASST